MGNVNTGNFASFAANWQLRGLLILAKEHLPLEMQSTHGARFLRVLVKNSRSNFGTMDSDVTVPNDCRINGVKIMKILIVDDDKEIVELLSIYVKTKAMNLSSIRAKKRLPSL